jgi:hypothetical protein
MDETIYLVNVHCQTDEVASPPLVWDMQPIINRLPVLGDAWCCQKQADEPTQFPMASWWLDLQLAVSEKKHRAGRESNVEYHFTNADLDRARQASEFPFSRYSNFSTIPKKECDAVCRRFCKEFYGTVWLSGIV